MQLLQCRQKTRDKLGLKSVNGGPDQYSDPAGTELTAPLLAAATGVAIDTLTLTNLKSDPSLASFEAQAVSIAGAYYLKQHLSTLPLTLSP
jgi:hypothetical protein